MRAVLLPPPRREWWCPHCVTRSVTERHGLHVEFHSCPGLRGVWAPMFERGEHGRLVVTERQDFVGRDKVTTFDGRPVMRVEKFVGDRQTDVVVFATSGQARLTVDEVADHVPLPVRRKGSRAIREHVIQTFHRLARKGARR